MGENRKSWREGGKSSQNDMDKVFIYEIFLKIKLKIKIKTEKTTNNWNDTFFRVINVLKNMLAQ